MVFITWTEHLLEKIFRQRNIIFNIFAENGHSIKVLQKVTTEYI